MSLYNDLKNSEVSVLKKNPRQVTAVFHLKKNLDLFTGHFPDNPMLPGIFQIEMVKYAMEKALNTCLCIQSVKKTKFSSLIHPGETVALDIRLNKEENSRLTVKAVLKTGETVAGKINLVLTKK